MEGEVGWASPFFHAVAFLKAFPTYSPPMDPFWSVRETSQRTFSAFGPPFPGTPFLIIVRRELNATGEGGECLPG